MTMIVRPILALVAAISLAASACGGGADDAATTTTEEATPTTEEATPTTEEATPTTEEAPTAVVTTNILGDVVRNIVGDQISVETIMPVGADPHNFQASAQQVALIEAADVLIINGADFEEGLLDVIASAENGGVTTFAAIDAVDTIDFGEVVHDDHDDHDDEHDDHEDEHDDHDDEHDDHEDEHDDHEDEHDDHEDQEDHHDHDHEGVDPHFFTDPARMVLAVHEIADFLIDEVDGLDADALRATADAYVIQLEDLDDEVTSILGELASDQRVLITNHEVFGYFADSYDFEVVGTVIPSGSAADGASAADLVELAEVIEDEGVQAIFTDTSASDELAQTLASEVGKIDVVELFTESLGDPDSEGATYIDMVRSNATKIAEALAA